MQTSSATRSLSQVIANNPREFVRHTWDNLRHLPGTEIRLFLVSWNELIGTRANTLLRRLEFIGLLAAAAWGVDCRLPQNRRMA